MSRRKDRERFQVRKDLYPEYKGYRGPEERPPSKPELKPLVCTVCGRKRNVPTETPEEGFVCTICRPEDSTEGATEGTATGE